VLWILLGTYFVLFAVIVVVDRFYWVEWHEFEHSARDSLAKVARGSSSARWWRCRAVSRPLLAEMDRQWSVTYSWGGGLGPGRVSLEISSEGYGVLRSQGHGESQPETVQKRLTKEEIAAIARDIDKTGLLCLTPHARQGYTVWDLGRYSIDVRASQFAKSVYFDECMTTSDPWAVNQVIATVMTLEKRFGERLTWGPYGTATTAGACQDERAN